MAGIQRCINANMDRVTVGEDTQEFELASPRPTGDAQADAADRDRWHAFPHTGVDVVSNVRARVDTSCCGESGVQGADQLGAVAHLEIGVPCPSEVADSDRAVDGNGNRRNGHLDSFWLFGRLAPSKVLFGLYTELMF